MRKKEKEKLLFKFEKDFVIKARYFKALGFNFMAEEDLAQELRIKSWKALDKWKKEIAIKGFLNQVCRNYFTDLIRKRKKEIKTVSLKDER